MTERIGELETDEELACGAQAGSHRCFSVLVERYSGRLYRFLSRRVGNEEDARDLTQDTFLKVCRGIGGYDSRYAFRTWLYTIARREAISHLRSRRERTPPAPVSEPWPQPSEAAIRAEQSRMLWELAARLKDSQHEALWLRYVEEMPVGDIACVMNRSRVHVNVLLHRARRNLAEMMAKVDQEGNVPANRTPDWARMRGE